ncbi:MAG TPA: glycosyltransferase [Panacibacter sp.]|nr:glycosyltransferase [Panacibacter sp.]HNP46562.1 glycosyltransferase [Panacibacter sp.]
MKIFIAHSWSDVSVNIQTKAVAQDLAAHHQVSFFSQARIGSPVLRLSNNLSVYEWPNKRPNTLRDFFFLCRHILRNRPDVMIVHFGATNICMIAAWLLGVRHRVCWLHTLTGQYSGDVKDAALAGRLIRRRKYIYALATKVVVLNEYGRADAVGNYRIPASKVYKIYNGIFPPPVENIGPVNRVVRFIGRLDHSKGVDLLLEAIALLQPGADDILFEIAGHGAEEANLKQLAATLGLQDRVFFRGYFAHYREALRFVAGAYCLVVPSRLDNFPTVILEALASGVPVVAFAAGGIPDMVADEKDGLLVPAGDTAALAAAIKRLLQDVRLREHMADNARQHFAAAFSMDQHVGAVNKFINQLSR